ncbi:hypothetical protein [uncultured Roseobacter sp.]|uniref:hypothetical protein n=1 Tax=uncultured Roseobacter sp. TaxID=114847 RepID=UPI00261167C9|nr:hypothetical protein [uncultured Roseobacter sp.]
MAASSLAKHLAKPNPLLGVGGVYPIEWRSKIDGIEASAEKHLNVLEIDDAKLKKLLGKNSEALCVSAHRELLPIGDLAKSNLLRGAAMTRKRIRAMKEWKKINEAEQLGNCGHLMERSTRRVPF